MDRYEGKRVNGGGDHKKPKRRKVVRPSRFTKKQKWLIAGGAVLTVVVLITVALALLFVKPELPNVGGGSSSEAGATELDYGDGVRPRAGGERKSKDWYTFLILGRDTGGGGNTDTMLLASYDVTNQKAAVMSIPRDTMVNVSWDLKKINSVYSWNGGGDKGIEGLYKEISQLVGFEPDYKIIVEWEAVGEIVEAMGGVYFDVPRDMYYVDPYQDLKIAQPKGYRLLSGDDAMQVIRYRHGNVQPNGSMPGYLDGDLGRIKTQQAFLKAMVSQLLQVKNITKINQFAKAVENNVETDLSFQNLLWFGKQAVLGGLSVDNVEFFTMPNKNATAYSPSVSKQVGKNNYQSYVTPIASELLNLVNTKLSPFVEQFTLRDLDIMFVNGDGSISSTTGYVEDKRAAKPPVLLFGSGTKDEPEDTTPGDEVIPPEDGAVTNPDGTVTNPDGTVTPPDTGTTVPPDTDTTVPPDTGTTPPDTGVVTPPDTGTVTPPVTPEDPTGGAQDPIITTPEPPPDDMGGF